jgi:hypothetical protein
VDATRNIRYRSLIASPGLPPQDQASLTTEKTWLVRVGLIDAHQALRDQRGQGVHSVDVTVERSHSLACAERPGAAEHRPARKKQTGSITERALAPFDRGAQGLVQARQVKPGRRSGQGRDPAAHLAESTRTDGVRIRSCTVASSSASGMPSMGSARSPPRPESRSARLVQHDDQLAPTSCVA